MSLLLSELNRLYFTHEPSSQRVDADASSLISDDGRVRAMVLELARPTEWNTLGAVWRGVQTDLALPAPAIAVSGIDGHQLWFSLAKPVCVADAKAFLEGLRLRYLAAVEPQRIGMMPGFVTQIVPSLQAETGRWSAFVTADLASIFADEPWLDLEPSPDAQARLLSSLECIKPEAFQMILDQLQPAAQAAIAPPAPTAGERSYNDGKKSKNGPAETAAHANDQDPKRFLTSVMNDTTVALHLRIEAAKALLPYS